MQDFTFPFAISSKSVAEIYHDGEVGIYIEGYCAVWGPRDRVDENWRLDLSRGRTSRKALETYFETNPIVLFNHGRDRQVGHKAVGVTVEYRIDDTGVWVKDFIPKPSEKAVELTDIYNKIKGGLYRAFSIAGVWARNAAKTIVEIQDVYEHSIAPVPVQGLATFSLCKSLELQSDYGLSVEDAFTLAGSGAGVYSEGEKAGARNSRTDKAAIEQAIALLEALTGESDEDDGPDGGATPMQKNSSSKPRTGMTMTGGKPNPFSAGKDMGSITATSSKSEELQLKQALNNLKAQGVETKMSAKTQDKAAVEGGNNDQDSQQDQGTITFSGPEAKAIQEMLAERETLKIEAAAKAIVEAQLAKEEADAQAEADAKRKYDEEVNAKALEIGKAWRLGSRMNFGGDAAAKSFNINKGAAKNEFSILKFAKYGKEGREWQYIENQKGLDAGYKALNETVGSAGGYLVPTQQSTEIVDLLRAQAVVRQMPGVRVIPMSSDTMTMPSLTAGASAYWGAEGAALTTSQQTFGQLRFVARKLYAVVQVTKEMMADANPGIEQIVREDIAAALALKEDDAFLQGSGSGETPKGILNSGIGTFAYTTGAASAAPEYKAFVKAAGLVRNNNARPNGMVMHSRISDQVLSAIDTTGQPIALNAIGGFRWADIEAAQGRTSNDPNQVQFGRLVGMTQANANQLTMSANTSGTGTVLVGDWSKVLIGDRQDLELEIDRSLGFLSDTVYIKVTKRCDIVVSIPGAFCSVTLFPGLDVA
jgi:HK97 family phage major capsid protein